MKSRFIPYLITSILMGAGLFSCAHVDDSRIPACNVNIVFHSQAEWDVYGVAGAYTHRNFIRELRQPSNFPFTANTYTGFGGILLLTDPLGNPLAYDLACPVEVKSDIRVYINDKFLAECPHCHSTYDVFSNYGAPVGDCEATRHHYGMRRYGVAGGLAGDFRVITYLP